VVDKSKGDLRVEEKQVKQLLLDITEAIRNQNLDDYLKGFHREVIVLAPQTPIIRGVENWRKFLEKVFQYIVSINYDEILVRLSESGDCGYCVANYKAVENPPGGWTDAQERLHCTVVKDGGVWKIVAFSWNVEWKKVDVNRRGS